jgi:hypothetical protein
MPLGFGLGRRVGAMILESGDRLRIRCHEKMEPFMSTAVVPAPQPVTIPRWSWAVFALALFASYLMLQENGLLLNSWESVHEFFHDGRHALGFPCH